MNLKKILVLFLLFVIAVIDILIYRNSYLYYRAKDITESEQKIEILEKAVDFFPSNGLIFYELAKAYFDLGINNLANRSLSENFFRKSLKNFNRSIRKNPASYLSHFDLAQSLLYMSYIYPSRELNSYDEYKKATILAGENSYIFFEVGKIFFARWSHLTDEDKEFTLDILKKIVSKKDKEKITSLLFLWEMNIKDYNVIEKILLDDPEIYRIYAEFLGKKSLSLEERKKFLAKAEFLEFEKAREIYDIGKHDFSYYRMKDASRRFKICLRILTDIRFYQNLTQKKLIDISEYNEFKKSVLLNMAKSCIEQRMELKEVEDYIYGYLSLEGKIAALRDFESYIINKGLISERWEDRINDLNRLPLQLFLYFAQNRYREIMRIGRRLQKSYIVIPESEGEKYVQVLQIVGDSYQRMGHLYDASDFYQKALDIDPYNIETMVRLRRNYEMLDAEENIMEINEEIHKILSPKELILKNLLIKKGKSFFPKFIFDGRKKVIDLHFDWAERGVTPLISVFFNGHVIWEDHLKQKVLSIPVETEVGKNSLRIAPINRAVSLLKLAYR